MAITTIHVLYVLQGKYLSTDTYEAHVWVIPPKEVVMCTDKRILYIEKNNVFGGWQVCVRIVNLTSS